MFDVVACGLAPIFCLAPEGVAISTVIGEAVARPNRASYHKEDYEAAHVVEVSSATFLDD